MFASTAPSGFAESRRRATMRQSSDTMCEDILSLVNTVKKYPCLYNFSIPEYLKKEDTEAAWVEVANYMRLSVHECKEKWRNLRYSFLRSLKPHPDGTSKKKYYLHREMEFLVPFMKVTRFDGAAAVQYDEDSDDETNTSTFINIMNGEDNNVADEPVSQLDLGSLEFQNTEPLIKRRKTTHRSARDNVGIECPRKMFLLGLLPEINSLDEAQMKIFRRKVFTLIDDITDGTGENNLHENGCSSRENAKIAKFSAERDFITIIKAEPI